MSADEHVVVVRERLARLEGRTETLAKEVAEFIKETRTSRELIQTMVGGIEVKLDRQQTFVGGVVFTIAALWAAAWTAVNYFKGS